MSTETLSSQNSALLARIETIESDAAAMKVAHSRSRLARLVILLMLAVAAVVFVYLFLSLATRFTDGGRQRNFAATALNQFFEVVDLDERAKAEQADNWEELLNQYSEMLVAEMQDLGQTAMPIVQESFTTQINKDMGKHRAMFNEQRDLLVDNLQTRGDELLKARYQKILDQHKQILQSEFEGLDDAKMERMLAHINIAMNRLVKKYYSDEIEGQFNQLRKTFDEFAVSDPPSDGETLNQQLLGTSVELLTVKFVGDPIREDIVEGDEVAVNEDGEIALVNAEADVEEQGEAKQEDAGDKEEASTEDDSEPAAEESADDAKAEEPKADEGEAEADAEEEKADEAEAESDEGGETESEEESSEGDAEPES